MLLPLQQGNRSFQAQNYQQAAAAYSEALALGVDDTSLTAVLLCNRAAAQHAAGQFLDAIADCCLAHQLDPKNPRALQVSSSSTTSAAHHTRADRLRPHRATSRTLAIPSGDHSHFLVIEMVAWRWKRLG